MRCSSLRQNQLLACRGILFAGALAFSALCVGQQSLHAVQFDASSGMAYNPMQSAKAVWCSSMATSLKGWGHERVGHNALYWRGALGIEEYAGHPGARQHRRALDMGMRRVLSEHVETGIEAQASSGTEWERNLRYQEEWRAFYATHWSGKWWMALHNQGRASRIYVEKNAWNYAASMGFDRGEFAVGADVRIPIFTRVRGQVRLHKIGQRRTHYLGNIVFELRHRETQFRDWAMSEGPAGNEVGFRSAAHFVDGEWLGYRLWTETGGAVRLEVSEHAGLTGGVNLGWVHRADAVRGIYDEDRARVEAWIAGSTAAWAGKARCSWNAVHHSGQSVYSEFGWDSYRYNHVTFQGRLERSIRGDAGAFVEGGVQLWRSNALPVGWYQRSDWTAGSLRCGVVWQASTAPRWERRHALKRRMAFE